MHHGTGTCLLNNYDHVAPAGDGRVADLRISCVVILTPPDMYFDFAISC